MLKTQTIVNIVKKVLNIFHKNHKSLEFSLDI